MKIKIKNTISIQKQAYVLCPKISLLTQYYVSLKRKFRWKCSNGHLFSKKWSNFKRYPTCPKCNGYGLNLNDISNNIYNINPKIKIISTQYINSTTPLDLICDKKHEFSLTYEKLKQNRGCQKCSKQLRREKRRLKFKDVQTTIKHIAFNCWLDQKYYTGCNIDLKFKCHKDHTFYKTLDNFKKNPFCSKCSKVTKESFGERQCRLIFETTFNKEFKNIRPKWLKNILTGGILELDGYNKELKLAFEYDGIQHYLPKFGYSRQDVLEQQKRDRLKDKLCKENNITLVRIPYWEKDNLEEFIKSELSKKGII